MTKKDIEQKLDEIREYQKRNDFEAAHGSEDVLFFSFIEHVAATDGELAELAKLVLTSSNLDFQRYCA